MARIFQGNIVERGREEEDVLYSLHQGGVCLVQPSQPRGSSDGVVLD